MLDEIYHEKVQYVCSILNVNSTTLAGLLNRLPIQIELADSKTKICVSRLYEILKLLQAQKCNIPLFNALNEPLGPVGSTLLGLIVAASEEEWNELVNTEHIIIY